MRLLFVTQDFPPEIGGIQTYSWELARRLSPKLSALEVVAPSHPDAAAVDREAPFPTTRVSGRPDLLPITGLPAVCRRARGLRPDWAFHAQWQTVGASLLARRLTGWPRRVVCAAHGRELLFNPADAVPGARGAYDTLRRWLLRRVDRFVPVSRYTARLLHDEGVPPARTHVVSNGTDPERFHPHDASALREELGLSDRPLLLTVGRLVPRKGVDTVLRALPAVAQALPDVAYVVVGTGPDRARLERLTDELGLREHVVFRGRVPHEDLPRYYSTADLFVMPAREDPPDVEGFGLVFLEANACGTPVIGARTGGIPDAIQDGDTGLLVPPADPEALADAIRHVLTQPDLATALGRQGRHYAVNEASWAHAAERMYSVLASPPA
jgi:phosphatidylinositol alpha-1,6-mannosyltransferase